MENNTVQVGPGFLESLGLLFIGLKLTGYINWSWWLVLFPLYVPLLFVALMCVIIGILAIAIKYGR